MEFYKYQGTGNDFVMIDNRNLVFPKNNNDLIAKMCDRRFGIGADGLILLENDENADFKMVYYNSDGSESTMCGNGGRCLVAFAHFLKIFEGKAVFNAIDGLHEAEINNGTVKLKMIDVSEVKRIDDNFELNTGSPHFVKFVDEVEKMDIFTEGKNIRHSETYKEKGINVNFVTPISETEIFVRTYERGVEDETYSCGTGVTASALSYFQNHDKEELNIKTLGGNLKVYAQKNAQGYQNIWLEGPAEQVFKGIFKG